MSSVFDKYSNYYDLIYADKEYEKESDYINLLITEYSSNKESKGVELLNFGCGTGRHDRTLAKKHGYKIHGVDLSSSMIDKAVEYQIDGTSYSLGDIRQFSSGKKYDVCTALFHVVSYLTDNDSVKKAFSNIYEQLKDGGVFVFDLWYGPGVVQFPPSSRKRSFKDEKLSVERVSTPNQDFNNCSVEVNFTVDIKDLENNETSQLKETHLMRYFFLNEIKLFAEAAGFKFKHSFNWMETTELKSDSWYGVFILEK